MHVDAVGPRQMSQSHRPGFRDDFDYLIVITGRFFVSRWCRMFPRSEDVRPPSDVFTRDVRKAIRYFFGTLVVFALVLECGPQGFVDGGISPRWSVAINPNYFVLFRILAATSLDVKDLVRSNIEVSFGERALPKESNAK